MDRQLTVITEVQLPSTPASIADVERLIDAACSNLALNEDLFGNVLIAVTEGVNNAIIHGNQMKAELQITVSVRKNEEWVCFSIKDQGIGFDPEVVPDPTEPENILKENGRGIFLMKNLSDDLTFEENGTRVNIFFRK
ncbi:MAG: ATP-binding protein [Flavobacteriales bacterium]